MNYLNKENINILKVLIGLIKDIINNEINVTNLNIIIDSINVTAFGDDCIKEIPNGKEHYIIDIIRK